MSLKDTIQADLKTAMLAKDQEKVSVLRGLKSAILYEEVAAKNDRVRETGLPDDQIIALFQKEAKKRQESADLFAQGGNQEKADAELSEKKMIEEYLPAQFSEDEIRELITAIETENGAVTKETMGATIAAVKARSGGAADGATVARLVKERISTEGN
jgi:uncharacterized protein YqeY